MMRQKKWKLINDDTCPLCSSGIDNANHIFKCNHHKQVDLRRKILKDLRDELTQLGTDPFLQRHLLRMLLQFTNSFPIPSLTDNENLEGTLALNEQLKLGIGNFFRGVMGWRLSKAQSLYYRSQNNFSSKGETWARKLTIFLVSSSHQLWKQRCDIIADSTDKTYDQTIRNQCQSLLIKLRQNPQQLPVPSRHLLNRKPAFTSVATTRALQSWLHRVQYGIQQAQSGEKRSTSDIRNWFKKSKPSPQLSSPSDEEEIQFYETWSDSTTYDDFNSSIQTVPFLPYVPYQIPTVAIPTPSHNIRNNVSMNTIFSTKANPSRDI